MAAREDIKSRHLATERLVFGAFFFTSADGKYIYNIFGHFLGVHILFILLRRFSNSFSFFFFLKILSLIFLAAVAMMKKNSQKAEKNLRANDVPNFVALFFWATVVYD